MRRTEQVLQEFLAIDISLPVKIVFIIKTNTSKFIMH